MKVLTYGDIMDGGRSVFTSVAHVDESQLKVSFRGEIRIDNPYKFLEGHLSDLELMLPKHDISQTTLDFTQLRFCNSNGFYIIMDLIEAIYNNSEGAVEVLRLEEDDWQQETLPILIDVDEDHIAARTTFTNIAHNE